MAPEPFTSLQYHLDKPGQDALYKLAQWARILGYINVTLGGFNGIIAIPLLFGGHRLIAIFVPSIFMSGILIYMGLQLTGAAANLRFAGLNENDKGFSDALVKIQKFFFLSATLYLIGFILVLLMLGLGLMASGGFPELMPQDPATVSI